jgi:hypothetical protein
MSHFTNVRKQVKLVQEMEDVKAANCSTALQNDQSNLVLCRNVL